MVLLPITLRANKFVRVLVLQKWFTLLKTGLTKVVIGVGISVLFLIKERLKL